MGLTSNLVICVNFGTVPNHVNFNLMFYSLLADILVIIHLLFIIFVVLGGLMVLKWRWTIWLHIPAAIWGALIEFMGWICPLTPLENHFRILAGESGYTGDFVARYILPLIYPGALTREIQILLGIFVVVVNLAVYAYVFWRYKTKRRQV